MKKKKPYVSGETTIQKLLKNPEVRFYYKQEKAKSEIAILGTRKDAQVSKTTRRIKQLAFHTRKDRRKTVLINLKVAPSQAKRWAEMTNKLGVDKSTFIRGAVESAIFNSLRAKDPQWQKFIEAIQATAQKILGHGFYDGGAEDFVAGGTERKGAPASEFLAGLKHSATRKHG